MIVFPSLGRGGSEDVATSGFEAAGAAHRSVRDGQEEHPSGIFEIVCRQASAVKERLESGSLPCVGWISIMGASPRSRGRSRPWPRRPARKSPDIRRRVLHQEPHQLAERVLTRGVDDRARGALLADEPRLFERLQVEADIGGGNDPAAMPSGRAITSARTILRRVSCDSAPAGLF